MLKRTKSFRDKFERYISKDRHNAHLRRKIGNGNPRLVLLQNADDLILGEAAVLHLLSFQLGRSLPQTGLGGGGNVSLTTAGYLGLSETSHQQKTKRTSMQCTSCSLLPRKMKP